MKKVLSISFCMIALVVFAMWAPDASAFQFYSDATNDQGGCAQCHTGFRDNNNYTSQAEGVSWGDSLHNVHLNNTNIDSTCDNCHFGAGTAGRTVNISSSAAAADGVNAIACTGCHGRLEDANTVTTTGTGWGAGLRQHHFVNGQTICLGCHEDSDPAAFTPAGEDVMPPFYGSIANTIVGTLLEPCNAAGEEQLAGDTIGLDNDGDNAYDTADSDCGQPAGPTLSITSQSVDAGQTVTVPVNYIAEGNLINTVLFSVDFDETNLIFDPASTMGFPWPDAITVNPSISPFVFSIGITYDATDTDGELDFTFSDINPPLTALPDGDLVTITFTAGNPAATTDAPVVFSQNPAASFGNTAGESVPGTTVDGSILITVICTPTGLPDDNCDGIDDDCNGTADDAYQPTQTFCGQGVCANTGLLECQSGQLVDTCVELPQDEATDVTCDNRDGDCDGSIDEDYTPVPTTCGVGECAGNTGAEECQGGVIVDTCDPLAGATAEICDNLDNDCDGPIDENLTRPTTCGVGECAGNTGEETCTAGMWGGDTCDPLAGATAEICDNLDNDCDGPIDENLTRPTTCGVGECAGNTGEETCTAGMWGGDTCDPLAGATAEVCDNLDNDCDGPIDENLTRPTTCGVGECSGNTGEETCSAGTWGGDTCDPLAGATAEICDNLDNDCDGPIDENLTKPTTCGVGECAGNTGQETCTAGTWGGDTCDPLAGATAEVCDNLDNDCDGPIDENLTRPTTCGVGECSGNTGEETCSAGTWGGDTCDPLAGATAEICDNLDNDCDGPIDENLTKPTTCGVGECAGNTGQETCTAGTWGGDTCDPLAGATSEICDNLDNDCDGPIDENLTRPTTCGVGECAGNTGQETCSAGTWGGDTCDPFAGAVLEGPPGDATCGDTVDNDCDGQTDLGDQGCQVVCTPTGIPESVCNGDDDDCDGAVDEDYMPMPTTCGVGECASTGQTTCIAGIEGDTCSPGTPVAEVCDNLDNDCDGATDENLTRSTTCGVGECAGNTGAETCTAGTWGGDTCDPLAGATAEVCDNLDNDCDGPIDENLTRATTCGVGECAGNTGAETCTAGTWGGDTCDPLAGALPEGPLGDVTCGDTLDNDCDGTTDAGDFDCTSGGGSEKILYAMPSSGVNIANGIQTDHGSCSNDPSSAYVEELSTNLNDMCTTSYRYEQFSVGLHSEHYFNTAYVSNTTVTGVSYQFTIRDGGTFGIQLFYVISDGNRTYLGTEVTRSNPGGSNNYTVDLSGQSGTVPAGAKLGLRTRLVSLSDTDTRVYLGNPDGRTGNISGKLIINESTGGGSSCPDGDNDGYAVCDGFCDPGGLLCGDCNDGDQLINPSGTEVCDDLDNDCDGLTDENLTRPTTCGIGECAGNTGEETCSAGMWGNDTCDPFLGSLPEGPPGDATCGDTLDNDCDGLTDLADISCQEVLIDLDIERFRVSGSAKIGSEVKRIQLTVRNANGASQDGALATLIGVQNGQQVYSQNRFVFDLSGRGRSRFAFPPFTPTESGRIDWTVEIFDEDPDDDTATASTNVK